jgi:hypothetical protein
MYSDPFHASLNEDRISGIPIAGIAGMTSVICT